MCSMPVNPPCRVPVCPGVAPRPRGTRVFPPADAGAAGDLSPPHTGRRRKFGSVVLYRAAQEGPCLWMGSGRRTHRGFSSPDTGQSHAESGRAAIPDFRVAGRLSRASAPAARPRASSSPPCSPAGYSSPRKHRTMHAHPRACMVPSDPENTPFQTGHRHPIVGFLVNGADWMPRRATRRQ